MAAKNLLTFARSAKETFDIPTLSSVSALYAELVAKSENLRQMEGDAKAELFAIEEALRASGPGASIGSETANNEKANRIAALLGEEPPPENPSPNLRQEQRALKTKLEDIAVALREINSRIRAEQLAASDIICEQIAPVVRKHMGDLLSATLALHAANVAFTALGDELNGKQVLWSRLNPVIPKFADDPRNAYGDLAQFLLEAVQEGWLEKDRLPKEFAQ